MWPSRLLSLWWEQVCRAGLCALGPFPSLVCQPCSGDTKAGVSVAGAGSPCPDREASVLSKCWGDRCAGFREALWNHEDSGLQWRGQQPSPGAGARVPGDACEDRKVTLDS